MAHPVLHDIRRVFFSKTVLVAMILLVAISFILIYGFSVTSSSQIQPPNSEVLSWYDSSGTYHFLVFESNQFGQPISSVTLQANLTASTFSLTYNEPITNPGSYPLYQGPSVTTNSSGEAEFTIQVPTSDINQVNANYTVQIVTHEPNGFSESLEASKSTPYSVSIALANGNSTYLPASPEQVVSITDNSIGMATNSSNSQKQDLLITWAGNNGSLPTGYSLYYEFFNDSCIQIQSGECGSSFSPPSYLSESNMTFLATLTTYQEILSPPQLEANLGNASVVAFGLFSSTGYSALSPAYYQTSQLYPAAQSISLGEADQVVVSFLSAIYALCIPLIAIIGSYNSYGKDRVSGVLESVLVQPVSRRNLALSRFFATFTGMAIAISVSMGVVDGLVYYYAKAFISTNILLGSIGAFCVELGAFIGLTMLLSRVVKSSGLLMGIGIGLFLIFDFLWGILILLISFITRTAIGSNAYTSYQVAAQFVNPAQFIQLVITYLTGQGSAGLISPSQYGITIPSLVATGILWVAAPLAGFLYLATKRD